VDKCVISGGFVFSQDKQFIGLLDNVFICLSFTQSHYISGCK